MKAADLVCPKCGAAVTPDGRQCEFCGAAVVVEDPNRRVLVHEEAAEYCPLCGRARRKLDTFLCRRCRRPHLCQEHQTPGGVCTECAEKDAIAAATNSRRAAQGHSSGTARRPGRVWIASALAAVPLLAAFGWWWSQRAAPLAEPERSRLPEPQRPTPTTEARTVGVTTPVVPATVEPPVAPTTPRTPPSPLPVEVVRRIRGVCVWSDETLRMSLVNGTSWTITEIGVRVQLLETGGEAFVDNAQIRVLTPKDQPASPGGVGNFEGVAGQAPPAFRCEIVAARGQPPAP